MYSGRDMKILDKILELLASSGPCSVSEISRHFRLDQDTSEKILVFLLKCGFIQLDSPYVSIAEDYRSLFADITSDCLVVAVHRGK